MYGLQIPDDVLQKIAAAGFRPPPPAQLPGFNMQMPQMQQQPPQPGFGMAQGAGMLGAGFGAYGRMPKPGSTPGDVMVNAPSSIGGQSIDAFRGPGTYGYGANAIDFLTGQQLAGTGGIY
jgi:hypothetical protein